MGDSTKYFKVPIKDKYATFNFMPYWQIVKILEQCNIPYEMYDTREELFKGKKFKTIKCNQQKLTRYKILKESEEKIQDFFFTADVIDKVLDAYNIKYSKEVK